MLRLDDVTRSASTFPPVSNCSMSLRVICQVAAEGDQYRSAVIALGSAVTVGLSRCREQGRRES